MFTGSWVGLIHCLPNDRLSYEGNLGMTDCFYFLLSATLEVNCCEGDDCVNVRLFNPCGFGHGRMGCAGT